MSERATDVQAPPRTLGTTAVPGRRSLPFLIGMTAATFLLLLHGLIWVRAVESQGGLERYARLIDFTATLTGAQLVRAGAGTGLYDLAQQRMAQEQVLAPSVTLRSDTILPYIHPPFEALIFAPFMSLPYATLYLFWSLLIIIAFGGSLLILYKTIPIAPTSRWLLLFAAASFSPLHQAFWLGQSSPLVLLGLCGAYAANKHGRQGWAGVALTLLVLKPQILLVIGLLLLLLRRWRMLVTCGGIIAGLCVAAMPVLGVAWPLDYARFLSGIAGWRGNHNEYPAIMYNWRGLLTNLLGAASPDALALGVTVLTLISLGLLVGAWWWSRADGELWAGQQDVLWSLACLVAILIAPHLYIHDLVLLILPAWLIVARSGTLPARSVAARSWSAALWCGYALAFSSLFRAEDLPALPVVPGLLLLLAMMIALLRQVFRSDESHQRPAPLVGLDRAGV